MIHIIRTRATLVQAEEMLEAESTITLSISADGVLICIDGSQTRIDGIKTRIHVIQNRIDGV